MWLPRFSGFFKFLVTGLGGAAFGMVNGGKSESTAGHSQTKYQNNIMKTTSCILIPIALLALTATLTARPLDLNRDRHDHQEKIQEVREELGLSDAQKNQIQGIFFSYRDDIRQQIAAGRTARQEMEQAVKQHGPESEEAGEAAAYIGEVAESRALLLGEILTEVSAVLTDEQRETLGELRGRIQEWIEGALSAKGL